MDMNDIRVVIGDDDLSFQKTMVIFLNKMEGIHVVGTAATKEEIVKLTALIKPDIILMDLNLSDNHRDGIAAAKEILKKQKVKIVMLTAYLDAEIIIDSFKSGAVEFVLKTNYKILPELIKMLFHSLSPIEILLYHETFNKLSACEKEVLRLLNQGKKPGEVCEILHKSPQTLKNQISSINKKLQVSNYKEAILKFGDAI
jgi:DNA-binding NarL/FixJ family response regulator